MGLKQKQIDHAQPGTSLSDGDGLILKVSPAGSKSWILRIQVEGKRKDVGLGSAKLLTLAEARQKARETRKAMKEGVDLKAEAEKRKRAATTFKDAAESYLSYALGSLSNAKHQKQWRSTLETYAYPTLGDIPVGKVDAAAIYRAVSPIWATKSETARRVRQRITTILNHAHAQGWRDTEAPERSVSTLLKPIKQASKGHFAAMPYQDVETFISTVRAGKTTVGREALLLLILTASRSQEVRGAKRSEFDMSAGIWTRPKERMKARKAHRVPLSAPAIAIVKAALDKIGSEDDALLFPGLKDDTPMSDMTLGKVVKANGGAGFTAHGFRSSFRDWAAENQYPGDWAESALAHEVKNAVEAAYRRTDFLEQRKGMMDAWAKLIWVKK